MLPRYALIGKSLTVFRGRVSILGGFLFLLSMLITAVGWLILSGEVAGVQDLAWWAKTLFSLVFSIGFTKLLGHFLFRPLPHHLLPPDSVKGVDEGLWTAVLARSRLRELDGFPRGSFFELPWEERR